MRRRIERNYAPRDECDRSGYIGPGRHFHDDLGLAGSVTHFHRVTPVFTRKILAPHTAQVLSLGGLLVVIPALILVDHHHQDHEVLSDLLAWLELEHIAQDVAHVITISSVPADSEIQVTRETNLSQCRRELHDFPLLDHSFLLLLHSTSLRRASCAAGSWS